MKATEVGIASWVAKAWSASAGEALVPDIQPELKIFLHRTSRTKTA